MGNAAARSLFALGLLIGACSTAAAAEHSAGEQCPKWLLGRIPPHAAGAADGSDFVRETSALWNDPPIR